MSDDFRDPSDSSDESVRTVDRLAQLAREAEPPKLSAVETDALVAAVLARRREPARADSTPPTLREEPLTPEEHELAQPDPLDERSSSAEREVASSKRDLRDGVAGRIDLNRPARHVGTRGLSFAAAAVLALGVASGFAIGRREVDPSARTFAGPPSRVTFPSGDTIVATAGAELTLVHADDEMRSLEVLDGTVLFDVAPLAPGERFVVEARGVRTEVRGTVFSVDAEARVRVYEGSVAVKHDGASALVTAGRMWSDGEVRARDEGPLEAEGLDAAARRERAARTVAVREVRDATDELVIGAGTQMVLDAANDTPANDTPANDTPANDSPANDSPANDTPANDTPANDSPAMLRSAGATPSRATRDSSARDGGSNEGARITPDVLARWIAEGDAERALVEARRRGWRLPEADALRALRRWDEALTIYERLAGRDGYAAFTGARVASQELGDRTRALTLLERAPASAFDERALGLRVRLLVEGGRRVEALPLAARYVARFPNGSLAEWMRALPDAE